MNSKRAAFLAIALLATLLPASISRAAETNQEKGDDFSVSLPSEPISLKPGDSAETSLRIVNRSDRPTSFHINGVVLQTGNEGSVVVEEGSDDWTRSVTVPDSVTVPAGDFIEVPVHFKVPTTAKADIHLVGFAVAPLRQSSGNSVDVRTQAVSYLPVDVAGDAHRTITIHPSKLPRLIIGDELKGSILVTNSGDAGLRFRAQVFLNSPTSNKNQGVAQAGDKNAALLLPIGKSRTVDYSWKFKGLITITRPKVEVGVTGGEAGAANVTKTLPIVVVMKPGVAKFLEVLGVMFLIAAIAFVIRRIVRKIRRRKARQTAAN